MKKLATRWAGRVRHDASARRTSAVRRRPPTLRRRLARAWRRSRPWRSAVPVAILAGAILYMTWDDEIRTRLLSFVHAPADCDGKDGADPAAVRDGGSGDAPGVGLGEEGAARGSYRTSRAPAAEPVAN